MQVVAYLKLLSSHFPTVTEGKRGKLSNPVTVRDVAYDCHKCQRKTRQCYVHW